MDYVVAGTGSRELQKSTTDEKFNVLLSLRERLFSLVETHGSNLVVMSGMAEGFDKALAVSALSNNIRLWCAIPHPGYGRFYWGENSLTGRDAYSEFEAILANAWKVSYISSDIYSEDGVHSNFTRNAFMVDQGNEFFVWNPRSRGTRHCFSLIKQSKKPYDVLFSPSPCST